MCLNLMISKYPGVNLNEFCHSAETSNKPTAIKPIFMSAHDESTNTGTSFSSHPLGTGTKTNSKKTTVYTIDHLWESTGTLGVYLDFGFNKPHGQEGKSWT